MSKCPPLVESVVRACGKYYYYNNSSINFDDFFSKVKKIQFLSLTKHGARDNHWWKGQFKVVNMKEANITMITILHLTTDLTHWTLTMTAVPVKLTWWTRPGPPSPSTECWQTTQHSPAGRSTCTRARWWSWSRLAALAGGTSDWPGTMWLRAGLHQRTWRSYQQGTGHWTDHSVGVSLTVELCWLVNCFTVLWQQFSQIMIAPTISKTIAEITIRENMTICYEFRT